MKKLMPVVCLALLSITKLAAQNSYQTNHAHISFFSEAPVADVDATNEKVKVELNTSTNEVTFAMSMADFQFKNHKMGRDAEKKHLETEKFRDAGFTGKIVGKINYHKPGSYPVRAVGKLKIHGVEKSVSEKGTLTVGKAQIKLKSEFRVLLKDYGIDTPSILGKEMTADYVTVKVDGTLLEQPMHASVKKH
jgi:polyisoprenoid-binding protein YceI